MKLYVYYVLKFHYRAKKKFDGNSISIKYSIRLGQSTRQTPLIDYFNEYEIAFLPKYLFDKN